MLKWTICIFHATLLPRQDLGRAVAKDLDTMYLHHAGELDLVLLGADQEMKLSCPKQILSLVWDMDPCFLLKGEDGVNRKGALERCHQIQHCSSQYSAFHSQEMLCLADGNREVESRKQRKKMRSEDFKKMKLQP